MGMASPLILVANPGSASRKYALYQGDVERATLHFENKAGSVHCELHSEGYHAEVDIKISTLSHSVQQIMHIFFVYGIIKANERIDVVGLRVVAPGSYFLQDRLMDNDYMTQLQQAKRYAPLHISATLEELESLREQFKTTKIIGISDSTFHATKPDYAWNYGIALDVADAYDIKRFGYHGISMASTVHELKHIKKLPRKMVVCHLGSGVSVSAILAGKSIDTTMGYSPLEGLIMSTRSGSIDVTALRVLKEKLGLDDNSLEEYLNKKSGLLGIGGSADLRELLQWEKDGNHTAHLAVETFLYNIQKSIGQMSAALGGIDALVLTGTVSERSSMIRRRVVERLHYLDLTIDNTTNNACVDATEPTVVSIVAHSKPIIVVPTKESTQIARHAAMLI